MWFVLSNLVLKILNIKCLVKVVFKRRKLNIGILKRSTQVPIVSYAHNYRFKFLVGSLSKLHYFVWFLNITIINCEN